MSKTCKPADARGEMDAWFRRRLPVWVALSGLFLDAKLSRDDYKLIADAIRIAGFSMLEAEGILLNEMAPLFAYHLMAVASGWTGWRDETVFAAMLRDFGKGRARKWVPRRRVRADRRALPDDWAKVAARLES